MLEAQSMAWQCGQMIILLLGSKLNMLTEASLIAHLVLLVASHQNHTTGSSERIAKKKINTFRKTDMFLQSHLREKLIRRRHFKSTILVVSL